MKILSSEQTRAADQYTIDNEPVLSIDLMERAARQLFRQWLKLFTVKSPVEIYAGPGNNGGDGIALARMLAEKGYSVNLFILKSERGLSEDSERNYRRLPEIAVLKTEWLDESSSLPVPDKNAVIVDALFGSGLTRPLDGLAASLVDHLNSLPNTKVSVDIPSGLFAEDNTNLEFRSVVKADYTWCFQFPKLAFMMPENEVYTGEWKYLDIGLHQGFIDSIKSAYNYITGEMATGLLKSRSRFAHKGDFGHALLIAGSKGKFGAAVLSSRACLRTGVGLLSCHIPSSGLNVIQTAVPESMATADIEEDLISNAPELDIYNAVGAGPGIGTHKKTAGMIEMLFESGKPLLLDADALNIISQREDLINKIPAGTILTPHPGEYKRLFGNDNNHFSRLLRMKEISSKAGIIIVLKGANTAIADPDGNIWFNSSGNPGMATAGSGDVLSGIILSLLAQGYHPVEAAILGVYIHGTAGDLAAGEKGFEGLIAGDIIEKLPAAFKVCKSK